MVAGSLRLRLVCALSVVLGLAAPVAVAQDGRPVAPNPFTDPRFAPPPPATGAPSVVPGRASLAVTARFTRDGAPITAGLHWRIYDARPDWGGQFRLIAESRDAAPVVPVMPGTYIIHAGYGLASVTRRVAVGAEGLRETFVIPAGGVRFRGVIGDTTLPAARLSFDIYAGSQFEPGVKRRLAQGVPAGEVVLLPEGVYHVVSTYGDVNAVVRSDIRIQTSRLTDATVHHRAAQITLKLVSEPGGEAVANTAWSVLTPGGDVLKEAIGAFPSMILQEGDYIVVARNDGRVFNREFTVRPGPDREVEVLARDAPGGRLPGLR